MASMFETGRSVLFVACLATHGATIACGPAGSAATEGETGDCPVGSVGCPCTGGGSCDPGLQCLSDLCVEDPTATSSATSPTSSGSATMTSAPTSSASTGAADSSSTSDSTATTTIGEESSTGEVTDWALHFDGTSNARKLDQGGAFDWTASDFTVEVWAEIHDTNAIGVVFDGSNVEFNSGWVFYFHDVWHALVFSFFNDAHLNQVVIGPGIPEIGTGWHHLAATKSGGSVSIFVDGVTMTTQAVPSSVAVDQTLWTLAGDNRDNPIYNLIDVTLDDVRVSGFARYLDDFDPPLDYDDDTTDVILLLRLDEGMGELASDPEAALVDFDILNPNWVPGNTP